jgi:hypothetical protein
MKMLKKVPVLGDRLDALVAVIKDGNGNFFVGDGLFGETLFPVLSPASKEDFFSEPNRIENGTQQGSRPQHNQGNLTHRHH